MLTPSFEVTQDDHFIYIFINATYSKVTEAEIFIEHDDFKFYAKPYFLRLQFPAPVVEDERASCRYEAENGVYKVKIPKLVPDTHFEDLDMLTKLLAPKGTRTIKGPMIEVLNSPENNGSVDVPDDEGFDWCIPQVCNVEEEHPNSGCGYGFANKKSGIFAKLQEDMHDVIQIKDLEESSLDTRRSGRLEHENSKFDSDHYLADLFEDDCAQESININPPWSKKPIDDSFTDKEKFVLKELPNVEYLLEKHQLQPVYLGLTDILFAYAYNWRCSEGDYSTESAWNIRTVSFTLSWCDQCSDVRKTLLSCYRRSLTYPLYRHWDLAVKCHQDVATILLLGKKYVLKCLLDIYDLFNKSDPYYILNDLYIRDYCIWIQKARATSLKSLGDSLKAMKIGKTDVGFELFELEEAACLVLEEEQAGGASSPDNDAEDKMLAHDISQRLNI